MQIEKKLKAALAAVCVLASVAAMVFALILLSLEMLSPFYLSYAICGLCFISVIVLLTSFSYKYVHKLAIRPLEDIQSLLRRSYKNKSEFDGYLNRDDVIGALYRQVFQLEERNDTLIREQYQNRLSILFSEMKSLEAQVNAHFLNNTLEAINSIAKVEEIESISIMAYSIGRMFHYSIRTSGNLVTLQDELSHLENYIAISEIRFKNKFKVFYDIDRELHKCRTLKLILQPIVENAVYHGLNPHRSINGRIEIKAYRSEHDMYIEVADNGVGMQPDKLQKLREDINALPLDGQSIGDERGIGLKNVHSRVVLYYGENYGLFIESAPNNGTVVTIKLPYQGA